jgi:hypothetical protein
MKILNFSIKVNIGGFHLVQNIWIRSHFQEVGNKQSLLGLQSHWEVRGDLKEKG